MEDDGEDFDTGGDSLEVADTPEEDTSSRDDVEEAVIRQRAARGDPNPRSHDYGSKRGELKGRADAGIGGNYEGLQHYHDTATRNGTTLQNAVRDWNDVESAVRRNPVSGTIYALQRMGLNPQQVIGTAAQQLFGQNGNQVMAQQNYHYAVQHHTSEISRFAADPANKYFPYVRPRMAQLVQAGRARDLKSAYRMAINEHPQLRAQAKMDRSYARTDKDKARAKRFTSYGGY